MSPGSIQAVFEARHPQGSAMAFAGFDLLEIDGHSIIGEPWTAQRKRLADLLAGAPPGVRLVPVAADARRSGRRWWEPR